MNKKIISLSFALALILQPALISADTLFHLMDREKLILKAKELEEKANSQKNRIAYLEKQIDILYDNQQTMISSCRDYAYGAFGAATIIAFIALHKTLTKRR